MTPLAKAKQLLAMIEDDAAANGIVLPESRYAQVGAPVVACSLVTVAASTMSPAQESGPVDCNATQMGQFQLIIARSCGRTYDDYGTDDPALVAAVSEEIDGDADLLWRVANEYKAYITKSWNVGWDITGNLGITALTLTTGID